MSLLTSLISGWENDDSSGPALDAASTNDLTENGSIASVAGKIGTARLLVAASSNSFSHADNVALSTGNIDWSVTCWFKLTSLPGGMVLVCKLGTNHGEFNLRTTGGSTLNLDVYASSGFGGQTSVTSTFGSLSTGVWYFGAAGHVAGASGLIWVSVNAGTPDTASKTNGTYDSPEPFQIGAQAPYGAYLDGAVDQVLFYKRDIRTDLASLYNGGAGLAIASFGGGGSPYTLAAATGTFAETGNVATLRKASLLPASTGTFTETGNATTLRKASYLPTSTGSFSETGNSATFTVARKLSAGTGIFSETGNSAILRAARKLIAGTGSFILAGNPATLTYNPATGTYVLTALPGSFGLSGNPATLAAARTLYASRGSCVVSGNTASLWATRTLLGGTGSFSLAGSDASRFIARRLIAGTGSFVVSGRAATLIYTTGSPTPTPTPTFPLFPDPAFPNTITVKLCEDDINIEGGGNPHASTSYSFAVSKQAKGTRFEARQNIGASVTYVNVYFCVNPNLTLSRKIRAGDQIIDADGLIFSTLGPVEDRGGYGFLWLVRCEHINS